MHAPLLVACQRHPTATFALLVACTISVGAKPCEDERWQSLKEGLLEAETNAELHGDTFSPSIQPLSEAHTEWYKETYQDCVEGFLSLLLYMSLQYTGRREMLIDLADRAARELNPLALISGRSSWPLFGQLEHLHLVWQDGDRVGSLNANPSLPGPSTGHAPAVVSPILTAFRSPSESRQLSSLQLAYGMHPGAIMIDAGVFDGTDWTVAGVRAGAIVLGFEPIRKNRNLFRERFPVALGKESQEAAMAMASKLPCSFYTMIELLPGEAAPSQKWSEILHAQDGCRSRLQHTSKSEGIGHAYIFGAAVGEQVRLLNMTTRYDYSSVADNGYLKGPGDMDIEQVAMTTLDALFDTYLSFGGTSRPFIDVLKVDVEGYEMGVLRGAERILSMGMVHYIMMEFNPGMLGTTGTDPRGLLSFVQHYGFLCHSFKIDRPLSFEDFVRRYTEDSEMLPVQGLGELEDLVCENLWWQPLPLSRK